MVHMNLYSAGDLFPVFRYSTVLVPSSTLVYRYVFFLYSIFPYNLFLLSHIFDPRTGTIEIMWYPAFLLLFWFSWRFFLSDLTHL